MTAPASSGALLFTHLAKAERAGLPLANTIALLQSESNKKLGLKLTRFQRELDSGTDLATAGRNSGLFLPWEARLLRAAQASGQLADCHTTLAKRYRDRARRSRQLRNNMILPLLLFFAVLLIAPIPALYRGDISGFEYLVSTLGRILLFLGGLFLLSWSWRKLVAEGTESTLLSWLLYIPLIGWLIRNQQRLHYLQNLSLLLTAGLPAFDALKTATQGISHPTIRAQYAEAERFCRGGMDVATALQHCGALEKPDEVALANSAEYAGRLDTMIEHQATQLEERLDHRYTLVTEWAPRIFYFLILGYVIVG